MAIEHDQATTANKELVLAWFSALASGDVETAMSLIHPDFRYYLPGSMPTSGWTDRDGFLATMVVLGDVLAGPVALSIGAVTAEDDRVVFEAESDALLKSGDRYQNNYMMAVRVRDAKIVELKEFSDTLHMFDVIDHPAVRGEAKPRARHIDHVTLTLGG